MATLNEKLATLYYDAGSPAGYGSIKNLHQAAGEGSKKSTKNWLLDQVTYSLHYPARRRFKRNPIVSTSVGDICQADLVDMSAFASFNDGFKFLLTFVDVFSKQAFAVPIKNKSAPEIKRAFKAIFNDFKPRQIQTDRGLEFKNRLIADFMARNKVNLYFTYNQDIKAACVERFNRTLKGRMFRYFTHTGSRRFVDVLHQLLQAYNNTYHRSIRMRPNDVATADHTQVFKNLYGFGSERDMILAPALEKPRFKEGDTVRMRHHITPMDKGYYPNFTDVTFTVSKVIKQSPRIMYKVKDFKGDEFPRKLYAEDLLRIPHDPKYRIERIIKRKRARGGDQVFVKFIGYPDSANQWIPASSIENV